MGRSRGLRYGAVATSAAAVMLASGCCMVGGEPEPETVVIGADLELTGEGSALGTVYREALQLRVEQVNEQGLLNDRRLQLRVLDNRSDPATSATNIEELASDPAVAAIVTGRCSECIVAAAEAIESRAVPTISLAHADAVVEPADERRFVFKLGLDAGNQAAALVRELDRVGADTFGLVASDDPYGTDGLAEMEDAAERAGVTMVVSEQVAPDAEGVRAAAARIAEYQPESDVGTVGQSVQGQEQPAGPDAVVVWAPEPVAGEAAAALRDRDYRGPLLLDASAADELFISGAVGKALNNARMIFTETLVIDNVIATSPAKAARQTWFNEYTARRGTYHAFSSFAADAVQVVVAAINGRDSTDRDVLREAIENTVLDGFSGPIRLSVANHSGLSPQALTTVVAQGDRWRLAAS